MATDPVYIPDATSIEELRNTLLTVANRLNHKINNPIQTEPLNINHNRATNLNDPVQPQDAVNLRTLQRELAAVIVKTTQAGLTRTVTLGGVNLVFRNGLLIAVA